jgi:hypothetical protein
MVHAPLLQILLYYVAIVFLYYSFSFFQYVKDRFYLLFIHLLFYYIISQ